MRQGATMLTAKQKSMLNVLIDHLEKHDVPPSFEELCTQLDLKSKSGIHRLLTGLEERGYIRRLHNRARAIEILKFADGSPYQQQHYQPAAEQQVHDNAMASVPLLGRIAAGTPIAAISDPTNELSVPASMMGAGEYFALEVEGDSMIEAGILDGDTVLIEKRDTAQTGDIVVALVDSEEATLKRLRRKGDSIALEAANPLYETRIFGPDRVQIQGRLAGLIRSY